MARFVGANHIDMTAATAVQPAVINTPATYRRHRGFFASVASMPAAKSKRGSRLWLVATARTRCRLRRLAHRFGHRLLKKIDTEFLMGFKASLLTELAVGPRFRC
jgi:hypothetical protein